MAIVNIDDVQASARIKYEAENVWFVRRFLIDIQEKNFY